MIVEFALALPFLALLVLGVLEYGLAWNEGNLVERAASNAARTGSGKVRAPEADRDVIEGVASAFSASKRLELERIIIYRSSTSDGSVPTGCLNLSPSASGAVGVSGLCNVYSREQAENATGFRDDVDGCPGTWDQNWCPSTRIDDRDDPDYLGVYIEATYKPVSGLVSNDFTIERRAVYMLEPGSVSAEEG